MAVNIMQRAKNLASKIFKRPQRQTTANILMFCFILFSAVGAGMIFPPAGLIVAGFTCGVLGFLLGLE